MTPMFVVLFSLYDIEDWGGIGNSWEGVWSVTWSPLAHEGEGGQWAMPSLFPVKVLREHQVNLHDRGFLRHRGRNFDDPS